MPSLNITGVLLVLFAGGFAAPASLRAAESLAQVKQRVAAMNPEQLQQLAANTEEFQALNAERQKQLIELNDQIAADPAAAELTDTMLRFHDWFKELPPDQRGKFRLLTKDDERIAFIRRLQEDQRRNAWKGLVKILPPADEEAIYTWIKSFTLLHKQQILNSMPMNFSRRIEGISDETKQLHVLMFVVFVKRSGPDYTRPKPDDLLKLQAFLTPETKNLLTQQSDEFAKHALLQAWGMNVIWKKAFPEVNLPKLDEYAMKLPGFMRDNLERLPPDERERELRQIYAMANLLGFQPGEFKDPPPDEPPFRGPGGMRSGEKGGERPPRPGDFLRRFMEGPPPEERRAPDDRPPGKEFPPLKPK